VFQEIRHLTPGVHQRGVPGHLNLGHDGLNAELREAFPSAPAHALDTWWPKCLM